MKLVRIQPDEKLSIKTAIDIAMELTRQDEGLNVFIKRGNNWSKSYFWEVRDYTHRLEDIQFKACTIDLLSEAPTIEYLPTGVTNQIAAMDAVKEDWEVYAGIDV